MSWRHALHEFLQGTSLFRGRQPTPVGYQLLELRLIDITFALATGIIARLEKEIHELAGEKFNVASPKQLGVILFEKLGLEVIKKTKTGYSTDNDVLEQLKHPIAQKMIEHFHSKICSKVEIAGPGFINFTLSHLFQRTRSGPLSSASTLLRC